MSDAARSESRINLSDSWRRAIAEAVGTYCLVFAGTGAIVTDSIGGGTVGLIGVGITFGLIIMAMIYAIGHVSGAHINPAVTIALAVTKDLPLRLVPIYLVAQLAGGIAASLTLRAMFGNVASLGATLPSGGSGQSLVLEFILTFVLMFVIMAVATDTRAVGQAAAIAIGGTVALEILFGGPISGASMNPARSLGPALASGNWTAQWIYIVGPVAGAICGALVYLLIRQGHFGTSK